MPIGLTIKPENTLNAEAYCASVLEHGIHLKQLDFKFKSAFRKTYRTDIEKVKIDDEAPSVHFTLDINRNGIYDILPDGIIHQSAGRRRTIGTKGMLAEHTRFKKEEQDARKFFAPIEREIFLYSIFSELEERKILTEIERGELSNEWFQFWGISSKELPNPEAAIMLRLMSYAKVLKGNIHLTSLALSLILQKKVTSSIETIIKKYGDSQFEPLGKARLGLITTTQNKAENILIWKITIHDLKTNELDTFHKNKPFGKLIERFRELFIPLDIDAEFHFKVNENIKLQKLNEAVLGLGLAL